MTAQAYVSLTDSGRHTTAPAPAARLPDASELTLAGAVSSYAVTSSTAYYSFNVRAHFAALMLAADPGRAEPRPLS